MSWISTVLGMGIEFRILGSVHLKSVLLGGGRKPGGGGGGMQVLYWIWGGGKVNSALDLGGGHVNSAYVEKS